MAEIMSNGSRLYFDIRILRIFRLVCLITFLFHGQQCTPDCVKSLDFTTQPGTVTATEGDEVSFTCVLRAEVPLYNVTTYWITGGSRPIESTEGQVLTTVDPDRQTVFCRLYLSRVHRDTDKKFKCVIYSQQEAHSQMCLRSSDFGTLNVRYFPRPEELSCRGPDRLSFQLGEQIPLHCEGALGNPSIEVEWTATGNPHSKFLESYEVTENKFFLNRTLTADVSLHNKTMLCIGTSPVFPEATVNCSVGPLMILSKPLVEVIPDRTKLFPPVLSEINLSCLTSGYPSIETITWTCEPDNNTLHCKSNLPKITVAISRVTGNATIRITCRASNSLGHSSNSSIIEVIPVDYDTIPRCSSDMSAISFKKPTILLDSTFNDSFNFQCFTVVSTMDAIIFRWYIDGYIILSKKGVRNLTKDSSGSDLLIVQSFMNVSRSGIITCEAQATESPTSRITCSTQTHSSTEAEATGSPRITSQYASNVSPKTSTDFPLTYRDAGSHKGMSIGSHGALSWNVAILVPVGIILVIFLIAAIPLSVQKILLRRRNLELLHAPTVNPITISRPSRLTRPAPQPYSFVSPGDIYYHHGVPRIPSPRQGDVPVTGAQLQLTCHGNSVTMVTGQMDTGAIGETAFGLPDLSSVSSKQNSGFANAREVHDVKREDAYQAMDNSGQGEVSDSPSQNGYICSSTNAAGPGREKEESTQDCKTLSPADEHVYCVCDTSN